MESHYQHTLVHREEGVGYNSIHPDPGNSSKLKWGQRTPEANLTVYVNYTGIEIKGQSTIRTGNGEESSHTHTHKILWKTPK